MECRFVVGQKVVAIRRAGNQCLKCRAVDVRDYGDRLVSVGDVATVAKIWLAPAEMCPHGIKTPAQPAIDLVEFPTPGGRGYYASSFRPVHDLGFWIGQEAAEKLKSGRGLKVPKPADDDRRGDVPVKERSRALDRA